MNKHFELSEDELNIILMVKEEQGFRSEKKALQYILDQYKKDRELEYILLETYRKIEENQKAYRERLKWATTVAEQNSIILLDILNTLLLKKYSDVEELIPVDTFESPILTESKEIIKRKIHHFKEEKDFRERKKLENK